MCAEFAYPQIFVGKERPKTQRTIGLRVHPQARKRVDAFIYSFPEGSRARVFAISCLTEGRKGNPVSLSDADYFDIVRGRLAEKGGAPEKPLQMAGSMPHWIQGDALRVLMGAGAGCTAERFSTLLVLDGKENVPGGKEEQLLELMRRHAQDAVAHGRIGRIGVSGTVYPFEEWLRAASVGEVNLLYYGYEHADRILATAGESTELGMVGRAGNALASAAAGIGAYPLERRMRLMEALSLHIRRSPSGMKEAGWVLDQIAEMQGYKKAACAEGCPPA